MFSKKTLTIAALLLFSIHMTMAAGEVKGPFLFDWQIRNFPVQGLEAVTPIPHSGHDWPPDHEVYVTLYNTLRDAGRPLGIMLQDDVNPLTGSANKHTLSAVMEYAPRLDFVMADFESPNRDAETLEMVRQVRAHPNPAINSAYVANYDDYAGAIDASERWPGSSDRSTKDAFYRTSGLNLANPACYPYGYFVIHTWPSQWGENISPNKRSALFWAPLEKFSVAKRNLPAGHLLIPWVGRFVEIEGDAYKAPVPTREDVRALIQHMRLRGADGYYRLSGILYVGVTVDADENDENMRDTYAAWKSLDAVFEGAGPVSILNLDTDKTGGIEWSGIRNGSKTAILVSNLGNSAEKVALPKIPGLPAYSETVAPGEHLLKIYDVVLPAAKGRDSRNGRQDDEQ